VEAGAVTEPVMKKRTILLSILAASAIGFIACASPGDSDVDESAGAESTTPEPGAFDYDKRMACLHVRRERVRNGGETYKRAFHLKTHGCVRGTLTVDPDLPAAYRQGVFTQAKWEDVWMRITNINQPADNVVDLRGLALKIRDANKSKSLPEDPYAGQDFLMNDTRVHFLTDPRHVVRANELSPPELAKPGQPEDGIIAQAVEERVKKAFGGPNSQLNQPKSLLASEYHSRAPFRLGKNFTIRYFVEPCDKGQFANFNPELTRNYLTEDFVKRAQEDGICFLLKARIRPNSEVPLPVIEDLLTPWEDTPVTLAKVEFPKQNVADNGGTCDRLWFSPLNTREAHEGLGPMNAGREFIYKASRNIEKLREKLETFQCEAIYPDFETKRGKL
jgi:hypothetical protein